jgi:hypothetical protein
VVADDEAAMMGVKLPRQETNFRVWPENWPALELFLAVSTQWRVGSGGPIGLDYNAVDAVMGWLSIEADRAALFRDLRVMEQEALKAFQEA